MVWYPKDDFDAAGYTVPTTFDELTALADEIKGNGDTPWCVASSLAGQRMAGDRLGGGHHAPDRGARRLRPVGQPRDPVQRPGGRNGRPRFGEVMFGEGNVLGGADQTPAIIFGDAPTPMFDDPPGCWLHRQASFINAFFPEGTEAGVDYDWFPFPPIDQEGILLRAGGGPRSGTPPEVVDFLEQIHQR